MAVNLVNVENVSKVYGTRALLDGVSLGVSEGDRIGVVGRNGDGKTTLIRMLAKLEEADTGRVTHSGGLRTGVLTQHDSLDPTATVRHEVIRDLADHEWAGNAKIKITVSMGGRSKMLTLDTNGPNQAATAVGYSIKLIGLTPEPRSNIRINRNGYVATFEAEKLTR